MIAERLAAVRQEIATAAQAAGRDPATITLVGVSKLQTATAAAAAVAAGLPDLGENYAQELRDKARLVMGARWHFVGPLQRNKVKYVVGVAQLVHSLDCISLAEEIARRAATQGIVQRCLLQVNVAAEPQKSGCWANELPALVERCRALPALELVGLMCIPPASDAEGARPHFRALAELARAHALPELSMGMSGDFAVAIAEGATIVRIGTAIFGERRIKP